MGTQASSMAELAKVCPFMSSDPANPEPEPESLCPFASEFGFADAEPARSVSAAPAERCHNVAAMAAAPAMSAGKFSSTGALMSQTDRGNAMAHCAFGNTMRRTLKTSAAVEDNVSSAAQKQSGKAPLMEKMTLNNAPNVDFNGCVHTQLPQHPDFQGGLF